MKFVLLLTTIIGICSCDTSSDLRNAFTEFEIIPDVLTVAPTQLLQVSFPSGVSANLGNELTPTQTQDAPQVTWEADDDAYFSLLMTDPDAPSRSNPVIREFRHWLVMNIPGSSVEDGEVVFEHVSPAPPEGTGHHRYTFLVFRQPNGRIDEINEPFTSASNFDNRFSTHALEFAEEYNLGDPEFGNFVQIQYEG